MPGNKVDRLIPYKFAALFANASYVYPTARNETIEEVNIETYLERHDSNQSCFSFAKKPLSIHQSGLLGFVTALRTNSVLLFLGNSAVHFVFYYLYRSLYVPVYGPISGLKIHTGRCNNAALKTIH